MLIADMITCFDFEGSERLSPHATNSAEAIIDLRRKADGAKVPVIYVNDNFGQWHSERSGLVDRCQMKNAVGDFACWPIRA